MEKKIKKVVNGKVMTKKKGGFDKLRSELISEEASDIGSYVFFDLLIPIIKDAVVAIITDSTNMLFYGDRNGNGSRRSGSNASYVSYRDYANRDRFESRSNGRSTFNMIDDIVLSTKADADDVLNSMDDILNEYHVITIADVYDLVGYPSKHTDNKYGWTNIRNAHAVKVRDGWLLKLPKALPID